MKKPTNVEIADLLDRIADVLDVQDANPFRIRAYREGANSIRFHDEAVADMVCEERFDDLKALPNIGDGIAAVLDEYVTSGQSSLLEDLEGQAVRQLDIHKDQVGLLPFREGFYRGLDALVAADDHRARAYGLDQILQ